ncbi:complement factor H-related protein 1-like [Centroberyx affinis]|uniref:complement factor H-related protein 1-like n=1 Tax=Centroberyx affinis TaxID=166261 RepID=UPI003A5C6DCC
MSSALSCDVLIPDKMCFRCLGFVLLIWFPGAVNAQSETEPCNAPRLDGGFFVPVQVTYSHGTNLTYACDNGRKPAVEGWWATSTCQNGKWSPKPQCIDEKSCLPPSISNAKYTQNPNDWYKETEKIRITCDNEYEVKNNDATAECKNGTWTSIPICEKSSYACDEPPKIPHAVIIHQGYQDLFAKDAEVSYECEDGYAVEGTADTQTVLYCVAGNWTAGQPCKLKPPVTDRTNSEGGTRPGAGPGAGTSGVGGTGNAGGGRSTSAGSGTQPAGGRGGGGVDRCGEIPKLINGAVETERMSLKYKCNEYYELVGAAEVMCYSDGSWSERPTCKEAFCTVDTAQYYGLKTLPQVQYVKEGQSAYLECLQQDQYGNYFAVAHCRNRRISFQGCCSRYYITWGGC